MRKTIIFLAVMFMVYTSTCPVFADNSSKDKEIVVRVNHKDEKEYLHRAPARVPIEVCYTSFMPAVKITFLQDLGNMTVNVTNHSTGEYLEGTMTASTGVTMLPVSGTEGFYTITFTLHDGTEYYGEFEL